MKDKNLLDKSNDANHDPVLQGNVALVGFEVLDASEQDIAKRIVENYIRKMAIMGDYREMRLSLRQHKHGKTFKHEIDALVTFGEGRFDAEATEWNLYAALAQVCDKIMNELEHSVKKEPRHDKKVMK